MKLCLSFVDFKALRTSQLHFITKPNGMYRNYETSKVFVHIGIKKQKHTILQTVMVQIGITLPMNFWDL